MGINGKENGNYYNGLFKGNALLSQLMKQTFYDHRFKAGHRRFFGSIFRFLGGLNMFLLRRTPVNVVLRP